MIKNVDRTVLKSFAPLIPAEYIEDIESGEMFCLGALTEEEDFGLPAGVLVFSAEDGLTDGTDPATMIVLHWLYVAEEHREKGFANDLMEALSDVLEDSPAEGILCDLPLDSEYDLAEAFFVSWGFQFEVVDTQEMIISKDDCRRQATSKYTEEELRLLTNIEKPEEMLSVWDVPQESFQKAVRTAKENIAKAGLADRIEVKQGDLLHGTEGKADVIVANILADIIILLLPDNREDYAGDMSYAIMRGNEVTALMLVERHADNDLYMILLTGFGTDAAKELLKLLRYAAAYYYMNYPEETEVHVRLGTKRSVNLVTRLFPDEDPVQVRRGIFY